MAFYPSRKGSNFCRFFGFGRRKNNDIFGIYFVRNNWVFADAPEPVQNKIQKKKNWGGIFPIIFFYYISFSWLCFYTPHDVRLGVRNNAIFSPKKRETIRCILTATLSLRKRIPYLSANRVEPKTSRDQHIHTCQFKITNVKIHLGVLKGYTHLISCGQMAITDANANFGNTLVGNDAIHDFRSSVQFLFSGI